MLLRSTSKSNNRANLKLVPKEAPPKQAPRQGPPIWNVGSNIATTADGGVITDSGMILCESSTASPMVSTEALFGSEYSTLMCDNRLNILELKPSSSVSPSKSRSFPFSSEDGWLPKFSSVSLSLSTPASSGSYLFHSAKSSIQASIRVVKTEKTSPNSKIGGKILWGKQSNSHSSPKEGGKENALRTWPWNGSSDIKKTKYVSLSN
jgi:hypothetical protein